VTVDWNTEKVVCTECGSSQPRKYVENSVFGEEQCKYCGGVSIVADLDVENKEIVEEIGKGRNVGGG